ncbi:MAG: TetR/AcrR family transcriptional regulator [Henriciella sp.]
MSTTTLNPPLPEASAPRRRNRRGAQTRQALIQGAISCLHAHGYAGTSIETVMEKTGISRGSVLNQFPTRLDLMIAAVDAAMHAMVAHTDGKLGEVSNAADAYRALFDISWQSHNLPEAAAVTEMLLAARWDQDLAEAMRPIAKRVESEIDALVSEIASRAGVRDIDACIVHVRILILSFRGITLELMYDPGRDIIHRALDRLRAEHMAHCDAVLP